MKILVNDKIEVEWNGKMDNCRGCGEIIRFGKTKAGKFMPFEDDEKHTAHWANCPKAGLFKNEDTGLRVAK